MNLLVDDSTTAAASGLHWIDGFRALGPAFFTPLQPTPLPAPYWVGRSDDVARQLGVDADWLVSDEALDVLTGNALLPGMAPLASVYSGHQFGVWAGQLGDGRAILLGETERGLEVQLKGAGRTPYSRMGDGRAVLRSSIREFLCSEAMHGLGIPTTRALAVTGSDQRVRREEIETAAVVTRVAPSFIRFGHFEHFAANDRIDELRQLADYVIDRYYPDCRATERFGGNAYAAFLEAVSERTAALLAQWQAVGFCHGVMNTDNMSILGLTIDYGPFQFLDGFDPAHICNHSDTGGRYAFNQQPNVAYWNLHCLAQALLPLIGEQDIAIAALASYKTVFPRAFDQRMARKLGLPDGESADRGLVDAVLRLLAAERTDWTIFWRRLSDAVGSGDFTPVRDLFIDPTGIDAWLPLYAAQRASTPSADAAARMRAANPKYVLRNHLGQQAIEAAQQKDFSGVATLLTLLASPSDEHAGFEAYAGFPPDWASTIEISCSS
ncbi:protein adenylyltransferase SelO [Variovorax arabinosiphilus]|uniref:protein adenylyltransferase SelO n=1 Tax=Variovorax arabinosiphilus TaxID=3053498 RepID=UPI0025770621|nr:MULTISPECIES: YdiU family protein [unclassified Variovorax]MDM0118523.1 YdiU family protein [Variovorax sp. J2L1-78]MDM0128948.1 YdiU family protein [Variovorax sp. J2L1-63]MDM0233267.1 YdiU family protein [Variovorax sp. J2R1-6]